MLEFKSLDLQQQSEEVQRLAAESPVLLLHHGKPPSVMISVDEFRRLKLAAGESLPVEVVRLHSIVWRGAPKDPLGYDTSDIRQVAADMAYAAESGRNRDAVRAEIAAVEHRLGISTGPNDGSRGSRGS